jgi:hypothetical protein
MKLIGIVSTAVLSLSLGALPGYAQQEQHEQQEEQKDKPAEQKEKKAQPEKRPEQNEKGAQQEKNVKPEEKNARQQENNSRPEEKKNSPPQRAQGQPANETRPANGKGGGRIPDDRYRANFGREHTFHVSQSDYSRDRRFQYGGYWFGFVDPWPSNWLYTQNVFVVDIDGVYYLCNPMYPGVNIALNITM